MSVSNEIYDDLDEFELDLKLNTINTEKNQLVKENTELKEKVERQSQENQKLKEENEKLKKNISMLFVTSKHIANRNNKKITSLQVEIENLKFRRKNTKEQRLNKRQFESEEYENFNSKRVKLDPNFHGHSNAEVKAIDNEYCKKSIQNDFNVDNVHAESTSQVYKENIQYQNKFKACKLDDVLNNPENDNNSVQQQNIEHKTFKSENIFQRRARAKLFLPENNHKISSNENSCESNEHHFIDKEIDHKELSIQNNLNQNKNVRMEQELMNDDQYFSANSNERRNNTNDIPENDLEASSSRFKSFGRSDRSNSPNLRNERYPKHRNNYSNRYPRSKSRNNYYERDEDTNDHSRKNRNYKESLNPYEEQYHNSRYNRRDRNFDENDCHSRKNYYDDYKYSQRGPRTPSPDYEKVNFYDNENKHSKYRNKNTIETYGDYKRSKNFKHKLESEETFQFNRRSRIDQHDDDSNNSNTHRSRSKSAHSRSKNNDQFKKRSRSRSRPRFEFDNSTDQYHDSRKPETYKSRSKSRSKKSRSKTPNKITNDSLDKRLKRSRSNSHFAFDKNIEEDCEFKQFALHQKETLESENVNKKKHETRKIDLDSYRKRKNDIQYEIENCTPESIKNLETDFEVKQQSVIESNSQNNKNSTQNSSSSEYNFGKNKIVNELGSNLVSQNVLKEKEIMKIIYDDQDFVEIISSVKNSIIETTPLNNNSSNEKKDTYTSDFDIEKSLSNENLSERKLEEKNNKDLNERGLHQSGVNTKDSESITKDKNNDLLSVSNSEKYDKILSVDISSKERSLINDSIEDKKILEEVHLKNTDTLTNKKSSEEVSNIFNMDTVEETTNIKDNNQPILEILNLDVDTEDEIFINNFSGSLSKVPILDITKEQKINEIDNNKVDNTLENILDKVNHKVIVKCDEKHNIESKSNEKTTLNLKQNEKKIVQRKYRKSPRKSIENITEKLRNKEKLNENDLTENKTNNYRSDETTTNDKINLNNKMPKNLSAENKSINNHNISEDGVNKQKSITNDNIENSSILTISTILPNTKESDHNIENKKVSPVKEDVENFISKLFQVSPVKQTDIKSASKSSGNNHKENITELKISSVSENKSEHRKKESYSKSQTSSSKKNISKQIDKSKRKSPSKNTKLSKNMIIEANDVQEKQIPNGSVKSNSNKDTLKRSIKKRDKSPVLNKKVLRSSIPKTKETQEQKLSSNFSEEESKLLNLNKNTESIREENKSMDKDAQVLEIVEKREVSHQKTNAYVGKINQTSEVTIVEKNVKNNHKQALENAADLTKEKMFLISVEKSNSIEIKQISNQETNVYSNSASQTSDVTNLKENIVDCTTEKNKSSIKDKQVLENINVFTKEKREEKTSSKSIDSLKSSEMKEMCRQEKNIFEITNTRGNVETIVETNQASLKIPADDEFTFLIDTSISVMNEPVSNNSQQRRKSFDENVEILKNNLMNELEKVNSTNNTCEASQSSSSINSDVNNSNSLNDSDNVNKKPDNNRPNHELVPLKNKHSVYSREVINENKIRIVVKRNRRR